ncbi:MAG: peptide chain release factor 1 [Rickettsiales bacterium]|nr:peptide chain release factor 1 [Rickettsiales bacterium]
MSFESKLEIIVNKHKEVGEKLLNPEALSSKDYASLSKEFSAMSQSVSLIEKYLNLVNSIPALEEMLKDEELKDLAQEELQNAKEILPNLEKEVKIALLPKDVADEKNAILEIRAGTGGDEAAIFAGDLLNMYMRYAQKQGWRFEIMDASDSDMGGYKEIICSVTGAGVFAKLKFESGVHRVQRVPKTETQGRIHTSAATVAVLPEAEDVDIQIDDKDLRIDVFRAQGAGGQHVNKTESAVRVTHLPTGIAVAQQTEKSQHKNKAQAMKLLKSKLYEIQRQKLDEERASSRKTQVGSGDRSEKIRTYNFPQDRVTDHRVNLSIFNIEKIIDEGDIDDIVNALMLSEQEAKLSEIG